MLVFAHRGYHADVPENTVAAFERAASLGVDGIETDVRLAAGGTAVLFHDRCLPDGRPVSALTRAELSDAAGYDVPTIAEALDAVPGVIWNIEIKSGDGVAPTIAALRPYLGTHRLVVTSFVHDAVREAVGALGVDGGLLVAHAPLGAAEQDLWRAAHPRIGTIVWSFDTVTEALLKRAVGHGFKNWVYGAGGAEDHRRLAEWQVDGAITDRPQYLLDGRGRDDDAH